MYEKSNIEHFPKKEIFGIKEKKEPSARNKQKDITIEWTI